MELEKQVCSLELAKKLRQLWVKQDSLFYWSKPPAPDDWDIVYYEDKQQLEKDFVTQRYELTSAFTVAELGEMLPASYQSNKVGPLSKNLKQKQYEWRSWHMSLDQYFWGDTEADARAKMLIYLLEQGLIQQTNSRDSIVGKFAKSLKIVG